MDCWNGGGATDFKVPVQGRYLVPVLPGNFSWGTTWAQWYFAPGRFETEEEPPEHIKELYDLWDQAKRTLDEQEHIELMQEILWRNANEVYEIGTVRPKQFVVRKPELTNFPEWGIWGFDTMRGVPASPEQYFLRT
jgi:peptide/nickel transport system substrate-binding protein